MWGSSHRKDFAMLHKAMGKIVSSVFFLSLASAAFGDQVNGIRSCRVNTEAQKCFGGSDMVAISECINKSGGIVCATEPMAKETALAYLQPLENEGMSLTEAPLYSCRMENGKVECGNPCKWALDPKQCKQQAQVVFTGDAGLGNSNSYNCPL